MKTAREVMLALWVWAAVIPSALAESLDPAVIWAMPTSARIKCVTTVPGRMTVEYGTTPSLGQSSPPEWRDWPNTDVTRHYVNLLNLQPSTTYYYRVRITPQGGGADLVSDVRSFKTFRNFTKLLPTVRYSSYIIGSDWSSNDTNAPYHDWNAQHYDLDIAYAYQYATDVKEVNPNAVIIRYDNITNNYAAIWREQNMKWQDWADRQGVSYEHIAMHYAVDTEVDVQEIKDTVFGKIMLMLQPTQGQWRPERLDYNNYRLPSRVGEFLAIAHPLRFDIVYFSFSTPASGGYDGVWEYCNAVDANGKPTSWAPLTIVEDTTVVNGQKLAQNGYVRFIPPKERTEWVRSRVYDNTRGSDEYYSSPTWQRGFHIRFRVTAAGNAPFVSGNTGIRHEDFSKPGPNGKPVIPGWDASWETNPANNGDPEYNPNPPSSGGPGTAKSARFKWWSRAWYYRPDLLRFLCNVLDPYYRQWIAGDWIEYIRDTNPGVDGWYCDNYGLDTVPGTPLTPTTRQFVEMNPFDVYQYGLGTAEVMEEVSIKLTQLGMVSCANNFVNLASGDRWSNNFLSSQPDRLWAYFAMGIANREISVLLSHYFHTSGSYSLLDTLFAETYYRVYLRGQYFVPMHAYRYSVRTENNTQNWWEREKIWALAVHLLMRDPQGEILFLNAWHQNFFYGEFLTTTSGQNIYYIAGIPKQKAYYIDAATVDFGQPITTVSPPYTQWVSYPGSWMPGVIPGLFMIHTTDRAPSYGSSGNFIGNTGRARYFARRYTRALVVLRTGDPGGVLDDRSMNEYTAFDLDGYYYRLRMDGTTDPVPINRLNLRHQEAAILIPASAPPSQPAVQVTISADKPNPKPLDVVTVTITATNTGNAEARNVRITHDIPQGATYVRGSLKLNGNTLPDPTDTTRIDVTVSSIPAGGQAVVVFQMVIR